MADCAIRNVVFDIGNVLVRWSPVEIVRLTFGDSGDEQQQARSIFGHPLWLALNKGELTESQAKAAYRDAFHFSAETVDKLFYYVKQTQLELFGSVSLLGRVRKAGYRTFALTDNVHEIVAYLKQRYDFWTLFDGAIVSAEVGCLKPGAEIYQHLIEQFQVDASESVFIDDRAENIEGARELGFQGIQFFNAAQCEQELKELGILPASATC